MLTEIIKKIAEETQVELQPYRHRPSQVGKCIRALVYHAKGVERSAFPGRAILTLDDSAWHEELTADWIEKSAYKLHSRQMRIDIFPEVYGTIDGILQDPLGKEYLWEHKALNHFSFERVEKDVAEANDYIWQAGLYLFGLQKLQPEIAAGVLHIKNKNTANYLEFLLAPADDWTVLNVWSLCGSPEASMEGPPIFKLVNPIKAARDKFIKIDEYKNLEELPGRPYLWGDWHCDYCGWAKTCWEGYKEEVGKLPVVELPKEGRYDLEAWRLLDIRKKMKELKAEAEAIQTILKEALARANAKSGRAGDYIISRQIREIKGYKVENRIDEVLMVREVGNDADKQN